MKKIKFSVLMLLLMYVLVACGVKADNTSENGGEGCNTADGIVDEETFDQLIKESENVELKEKVLEYIKNDEYHHVIDEVDKDAEKEIRQCIQKRLDGIPVDKIFQKAYFYGYEFKVDENVLSPRPESELLVENAIKYQ